MALIVETLGLAKLDVQVLLGVGLRKHVNQRHFLAVRYAYLGFGSALLRLDKLLVRLNGGLGVAGLLLLKVHLFLLRLAGFGLLYSLLGAAGA